jgi:hypothetical protein
VLERLLLRLELVLDNLGGLVPDGLLGGGHYVNVVYELEGILNSSF